MTTLTQAQPYIQDLTTSLTINIFLDDNPDTITAIHTGSDNELNDKHISG
jgi:hypothetical protein